MSKNPLFSDFNHESRKLIMIMKVDIGDGRFDRIRIHDGDRPRQLAIEFCERNGLSTEVIDTLAKHIARNVSSVIDSMSPAKNNKKERFGFDEEDDVSNDNRNNNNDGTNQFPSDNDILISDSPSVFDRLHALHAKQIEKTQKRQEEADVAVQMQASVAHKGVGIVPHNNMVGERLYADGLRRVRQRKEEIAKSAKLDGNPTEWICPQCSFANSMNDDWCNNPLKWGKKKNDNGTILCGEVKPKMFKPSVGHKIRVRRHTSEDTFGYLHKTKRTAQHRLDKIAKELEEKETAECSFHPIINNRSRKLASYNQKSKKPCHEKLFHEVLQRGPNADANLKNNKSSKSNSEAQSNTNHHQRSKSSQHSHIQHLLEEPKKRQQRIKRLKKEAAYDRKTGQQLFRPKTGRAPKFDRNAEDLPIGDFLYARKQNQEQLKEKLRQEAYEKAKEMTKVNYVTRQSKQIVKEMKKKATRAMFVQLLRTSDQQFDLDDPAVEDAVVDPMEVDVSCLTGSLEEHFAACFDLLDHKPVTFAEFTQLSNDILDMVKALGEDWTCMVPRVSRKPAAPATSPECSFRPQINPNSLAILEASDSIQQPIFDRLIREGEELLKKKELRLLQGQEKLQARKLADCTFRPDLSHTATYEMQINYNPDRLYETRRPEPSQEEVEDVEVPPSPPVRKVIRGRKKKTTPTAKNESPRATTIKHKSSTSQSSPNVDLKTLKGASPKRTVAKKSNKSPRRSSNEVLEPMQEPSISDFVENKKNISTDELIALSVESNLKNEVPKRKDSSMIDELENILKESKDIVDVDNDGDMQLDELHSGNDILTDSPIQDLGSMTLDELVASTFSEEEKNNHELERAQSVHDLQSRLDGILKSRNSATVRSNELQEEAEI